MHTRIPEKIAVCTTSQELLPTSSAGANLAILSLEIAINKASERSKAWEGKAVYKGTKGDRNVEAREFLVFTEGEDDFYASKLMNNANWNYINWTYEQDERRRHAGESSFDFL